MSQIAPAVDPDPGISDLLNFGFLVRDGVILCKDGSYIAGWVVECRDSFSYGLSDRLVMSEFLNDALSKLGGGWSFWYDLVCIRAKEYCIREHDAFPDEVTQRIDDERREIFESEDSFVLERKNILLLQFTPISKTARKATTYLFNDEDKKDVRSEAAIAEAELESFDRRIAEIEVALFNCCTGLKRLKDYIRNDRLCSDLVNYIDFRLSGVSREVGIKEDGVYLDGVFAYDYVDTRTPMMIGDEYIVCLVIDGFPEGGEPGVLAGLAQLNCEYVWSTRFVIREREAALRDIAVYQKGWKIAIKGIMRTATRQEGGKENRDAADMYLDALDAEHKAASERVAYGYLTSVIVLRDKDKDRVMGLADAVQKVTRRSLFNARLETLNTFEAFIGSIVGHPVHNIRRPMLNTQNVADLIHWSTTWRGFEFHPNHLYPPHSNPLMYVKTSSNEPFRLNFFDGDRGSALIFGPTGAGKTALLNVIAAQQKRYPMMRLWCWDFKYGMYTLAKRCGWNHYDLGLSSGLTLCPLGELEYDDDVQFAKLWIEQRFQTKVGRSPSPTQSSEIHHTIEIMRDIRDARSLSHFRYIVQDQEVSDAIKHFTIDGAAGRLLDAEQDTLSNDIDVVFECEEFIQNFPADIAGAVYSHLFRKFLRGLRVDKPSVMILDEAHYAFRDPFLSKGLDTFGRTIRSKNGSMIMATQSIKEALESDLGVLLAESCPTKILLPNAKAADSGTKEYPGPRDYYLKIGVTDADIDIIRSAKPKKDYYLISPHGKQLIDLCLDGTLLDIIRAPVIREDIRRAA